ncbi:hypothetical protein DQ04_12611000 [Trypanosoma grayi]|uniref:hypothetical protein n=1 Tax=Trypanosoma grayi TaxID=71804 RepID=UPI0004F4ADE6|nr:hypothetical protein DQ04_12611000 [Trypanosoma grayi]KEG06712.1 hypothetical protein DQ04_12611000 [Trypanosoma grayi]
MKRGPCFFPNLESVPFRKFSESFRYGHLCFKAKRLHIVLAIGLPPGARSTTNGVPDGAGIIPTPFTDALKCGSACRRRVYHFGGHISGDFVGAAASRNLAAWVGIPAQIPEEFLFFI